MCVCNYVHSRNWVCKIANRVQLFIMLCYLMMHVTDNILLSSQIPADRFALLMHLPLCNVYQLHLHFNVFYANKNVLLALNLNSSLHSLLSHLIKYSKIELSTIVQKYNIHTYTRYISM